MNYLEHKLGQLVRGMLGLVRGMLGLDWKKNEFSLN